MPSARLVLPRRLRRLFTSTSRRVLIAYPTLVAIEQVRARRRVHPAWAPLMAWGFLQYRLSGNYRTRIGEGGPGAKIPPKRIVETGIYAYTRNPMYLGHQIFLAGLALTTRSPVAAGILAAHLPWFRRHARQDEDRLIELFGDDYARYRDRVPRWLPTMVEHVREPRRG